MKKILICILCVSITVLTFTACGDDDQPGQDSTGRPESESKITNIDVDLTQLSSTMVYSEVSNMMTAPEDYIGKTVKMHGTFAVYEDTALGERYFTCIISDATACCSQGLEFTLAGNYKYPDDYPKTETEITVTGVFETYEENEATYCRLKNAVLE